MTSEPIALVPGRPDVEVAAEMKARIAAELKKVAPLLDEAERLGFAVGFQLGKDWTGKFTIATLDLLKKF